MCGLSAPLVYTHRSSYYDGDTTGLNLVRPITDAELAAGVTPTNLNYVRPGGRLDFGIGYELNDNLRVDVGGTHILGNKSRSFFRPPVFNRATRWKDTLGRECGRGR